MFIVSRLFSMYFAYSVKEKEIKIFYFFFKYQSDVIKIKIKQKLGVKYGKKIVCICNHYSISHKLSALRFQHLITNIFIVH